MVAGEGFEYRGDQIVFSQGKVLKRPGYHRRNASYQFVALQKDRQACSAKVECLPPHQKGRYIGLAVYFQLHLLAMDRNRTPGYRREMNRLRTIAEDTFTSLDPLGWSRSRLRRLWKGDCGRFLASIAHNVLKAVRRLGHSTRPPDLDGPHGPKHLEWSSVQLWQCLVALTPAR